VNPITIKFDLGGHICQLDADDLCIWVDDQDLQGDPDVVFSLAELRRILDAARMLRTEP
jgi:hypothetical protein